MYLHVVGPVLMITKPKSKDYKRTIETIKLYQPMFLLSISELFRP